MNYCFKRLEKSGGKASLRMAVNLLITPLILLHLGVHSNLSLAGVDDHDANLDPGKGNKGTKNTANGGKSGRSTAGAQSNGDAQEGCGVNRGDIANFANGESYNYRSLVNYLTQSACQVNSRAISASEIRTGISFNRIPFHLDTFSSGYSDLTVEGSRRVENSLANSIPGLLRQSPMSNQELLPILGQLALLSPKAARSTLGYFITQELVAADQIGQMGLVGELASKKRDPGSAELAYSLMQLGANETAIASEIADSVEEMAVMAQADSLGKMLKGLANSAKIEPTLAPTFNLSAGAFNRGVQRGNTLFDSAERANLLKANFLAIAASAGTVSALEPGAQELNEAFGTLANGNGLADTSLRKLWREAVKVAASSSSQNALAEALAVSLTPEAMYLAPKDRALLLQAAQNYPVLAHALQTSFVEAWNNSREELFQGKIKVGNFNEKKETIFEPWVVAMLDFEPKVMDPLWLQEVVKRGLVKDEDIEKKFPRFVLALMGERERASKAALLDSGIAPNLNSAFQNFAVLWTLSNIHVPALNSWVKKYEE